jgi:hypothetical protein
VGGFQATDGRSSAPTTARRRGRRPVVAGDLSIMLKSGGHRSDR